MGLYHDLLDEENINIINILIPNYRGDPELDKLHKGEPLTYGRCLNLRATAPQVPPIQWKPGPQYGWSSGLFHPLSCKAPGRNRLNN